MLRNRVPVATKDMDMKTTFDLYMEHILNGIRASLSLMNKMKGSEACYDYLCTNLEEGKSLY